MMLRNEIGYVLEDSQPQTDGEDRSPLAKHLENEMILLRADLKTILEPDKPLFEYANYVLRLVAWWVAIAVGLSVAEGIEELRWRLLAYAGLAFAVAFGAVLAFRLLMINRAMADAISWRYHQRGCWGLMLAIAISTSLVVPTVTLVLLIWAAIVRLGPLSTP